MRISKNHSNRKLHNWLMYEIVDKFLEQYIPLYKGVMYDFGCGEAPYRDFYLNYVDQYVGLDWAGSFHQTKADISADLNKPIPVNSEVADTVVSLSVMEHLCEPQNMLNEAYRILKPGGNIILQVPWQWWIHEAPCDFYRYSPYGLKYMFEKAGFVDVSIEAQSGFFTTWVMKFNYFTRRLVRGPKIIRGMVVALLLPAWWLGQVIAPILDKIDRNWQLESTGYYVTAIKSEQNN